MQIFLLLCIPQGFKLLVVNYAACNMRPALFAPTLPLSLRPVRPWITRRTSASPSRRSARSSTRPTASARCGKSRSCCASATRTSSGSTTFWGRSTSTAWGMCILSWKRLPISLRPPKEQRSLLYWNPLITSGPLEIKILNECSDYTRHSH